MAEPGLDFRALLTNMPVPVVVHEIGEGQPVIFVNPTFTEVFGYTQDDIPSVGSWAALACPESAYRDEVMRRWRDAIAGRQATGIDRAPEEFRILDKAGRPRDVLIGFAPQGTRVIVTLQDITGMRQAEATLAAERESTAYALTENMPAGAYTMRQAPGADLAEFAFLSRQFLEMLDLTREEAVGDPSTGFSRVHPEEQARWLALNRAAFATRTPFSGETRIVAHGSTRWVRAESVPRRLEDGSTLWEGVLVDITRLKETEARLQSVIDASRAFTWSLDLDTGQLQFNEPWAKAHGYADGELGQTLAAWFEAVHPDDTPALRAVIDRLRTGMVDRQSATYRRRSQDGRWLWLQAHAGISGRDLDGTPRSLSGVSFDVTREMVERQAAQEEQAQLREELQRAQQRDTAAQVAEGVAHDLNNLIAVISGTAELLELHLGSPGELLAGITRIRRSVAAAQDLVSGLEGLVRPNRARSLHDLAGLVTEAVDLLGTRRIARHAIRVHLPEARPEVWANPTDLSQVIVNLSINGCESGSGDAPATVELIVLPPGTAPPERQPDAGGPLPASGELALFRVTDTGTGIPDEVRTRMFRPHFTTKGEAGTGLGLLIVSTILQANRAALWIDTAPARGTTITIAWPAQPPASLGAGPASADTRAAALDLLTRETALDGLSVLVVDDIADVGDVLADMIEAAGATSLVETDPRNAMTVLAAAPETWSALVTDLHMPGIDGRELARFAAGLSPRIPVVLVTARAATLNEADRALFSAVLSKPVSAAELTRAIQSAAARQRERMPHPNPSRGRRLHS